jgi:hypothetical protein
MSRYQDRLSVNAAWQDDIVNRFHYEILTRLRNIVKYFQAVLTANYRFVAATRLVAEFSSSASLCVPQAFSSPIDICRSAALAHYCRDEVFGFLFKSDELSQIFKILTEQLN